MFSSNSAAIREASSTRASLHRMKENPGRFSKQAKDYDKQFISLRPFVTPEQRVKALMEVGG